MEYSFSLSNIKEVAGAIWKENKDKKIWAFNGEMGAGKTTFIHALCEVLQVKSAIGSPTYAIINEYESAVTGVIFHMDWYRLKDEEEAQQAGIEDALFSGSLCLVEWPAKAPLLLPDDTLYVTIQLKDEQTRIISV
jgi:tRNA threonylcarbamoyladenosine biosynthesis protein TsaE